MRRRKTIAAPETGSNAPSTANRRTVEEAVGTRVRALRKRLDMTVAELAKQAGLSVGMLSKIENGATSPSLATLQALADACEKKGAVSLGLVDGASLSVSCHHPYRPATQFYKIDSGRVFTLLDAKPAG